MSQSQVTTSPYRPIALPPVDPSAVLWVDVVNRAGEVVHRAKFHDERERFCAAFNSCPANVADGLRAVIPT